MGILLSFLLFAYFRTKAHGQIGLKLGIPHCPEDGLAYREDVHKKEEPVGISKTLKFSYIFQIIWYYFISLWSWFKAHRGKTPLISLLNLIPSTLLSLASVCSSSPHIYTGSSVFPVRWFLVGISSANSVAHLEFLHYYFTPGGCVGRLVTCSF